MTFNLTKQTAAWVALPESEKKRLRAEGRTKYAEVISSAKADLKIIDDQMTGLMAARSAHGIPGVRNWMEENELKPAALCWLIDECLEHSKKFSGRKTNSLTASTRYVLDAIGLNPDLSADEVAEFIFAKAGEDDSPYNRDGDNIYEKKTETNVSKAQLIVKIYTVRSRYLSPSGK